MKRNTLLLILALALTLGVGLLGALLPRTEIEGWFDTLVKPDWIPPGWIFTPIRLILFTMIGISIFLVWKSDAPAYKKRNITILFFIQLALNLSWSYIFFGQHQVASGFFQIIFLWLFIVFTILAMPKVSTWSVLLMIPYLLWVTFLGYLNYSIWELNA